MGLFKKRGDVIDLTKLKKSGVLDRSLKVAKENEAGGVNEGRVIDLRNSLNSTISKNEDDFGFLSGLAGAGDNTKNDRDESSAENEVKNKIEDLEYKLEKLIERLERIEERLRD